MLKLLAGLALMVSTSAMAQDALNISDARAKESIPGSQNGVAFATIENTSSSPIIITGVSSSVSKMTQIHTHVMKDGMMSMKHVPELTIPPGEQVVFQSGGYHFMLMGLKEPLVKGETFNLTISYDTNQTQLISVQVEGR